MLNRDFLGGGTKWKVQTCAGKVMVSVFCDGEGTWLVDFFNILLTVRLNIFIYLLISTKLMR